MRIRGVSILINSSPHVLTDKLTKFLCRLEADKHYPNQEDDGLLLSPPTHHEDIVQGRPSLRKCSSLKTSRSSPDTSGASKLVR